MLVDDAGESVQVNKSLARHGRDDEVKAPTFKFTRRSEYGLMFEGGDHKFVAFAGPRRRSDQRKIVGFRRTGSKHDLIGIAADRPDAVGQDIPRMARHVEYLAPMLYPSHWVPGEYRVANPNKQPYDIIKATLADFQAKIAGTGVALVPWLQDFSLGHPYGPAEVRAQMDAAASLGVQDWLLWNAGATYTVGALDPKRVSLRQ